MSTPTEELRARLAHPEPEFRRIATHAIPDLHASESCELLLVALADVDWRVRKEAASVATRIEPRTAVVFAVAAALADRDNIGFRNAAVEALVLIGPDAVPGAIDALSRFDADGRKLAVEVLAGAPTLAGMRALARALGDSDPNVVAAAAEALGKAHLAGDEAREGAIAALERLVESGALAARLAALDALVELGAELSWSRIEPLFKHPMLRRQAIAVAGGSQAPRALLSLAEAVAEQSRSLSREATVALGRSLERCWDDEDLVDVAAKTIRASRAAHERLRALAKEADDATARGAALLALAVVRDPDDVSIVADALADDRVADHAEAALRRFGQQAVQPLLFAGKTAAPSLRGAAISMLPELAPSQPSPLLAVREALLDASPEVVAPVLKSLAIVGTSEDLAKVGRHVGHPDARVATSATSALLAIAMRHPIEARKSLAGLDPRGESALFASTVLDALARANAAVPTDVDFLGEALAHRDPAVRRAAIDALASIGGKAAAAIVGMSLADEEQPVASAAVRALGKLGAAEQLARLAATTKDPVRLASVLRSLKDADPVRAFAAAKPLLRSNESAVAAAAVEVVGAVSVDGRGEALMSAVDHPDREVVKLALAHLAQAGGERALVSLSSAIEHKDEAVRRYAAELLGHEGGAEAEGILRARLDRERSADVRRAIMEALSVHSGPKSP